MAKVVPQLVPPILRLSADLWSHIPIFLHEGDLIRLIHVGNTLLTSRIRHHAHDLKLAWNALRFMDFDKVFTTIGHFDRVYHLSFSSFHVHQRFWTPIHMLGWPSSLVILKTSFMGCINQFMNSGNLHLQLPQLETLDLAENSESDPQSDYFLPFKGLPHRLQVLRLKSSHMRYVDISHLESLPCRLEELTLDFAVYFRSEETLGQMPPWPIPKVTLPSLPSSLTSLYLRHTFTSSFSFCILHIEWAKLPPSLQSFKIIFAEDIAFGAYLLKIGSFESSLKQSSIEITSTSRFVTPNLTTLWLQAAALPIDCLLDLVPPSVTSFDAYLFSDQKSNSAFDFDKTVQFIAPKLVSFAAEFCDELDELVLGGKLLLPKLKRVDNPSNDSAIIPPSVTRATGEDVKCQMPNALVSLTCSTINLSLLKSNLTALTISDLPLDYVTYLPETLEQLSVGIRDDALAKLFSLMCCGHMPHLTAVDLSVCKWLSKIPKLPPQLKRIDLELENRDLRSIAASTLTSWKKSNLGSLRLVIRKCPFDKNVLVPKRVLLRL